MESIFWTACLNMSLLYFHTWFRFTISYHCNKKKNTWQNRGGGTGRKGGRNCGVLTQWWQEQALLPDWWRHVVCDAVLVAQYWKQWNIIWKWANAVLSSESWLFSSHQHSRGCPHFTVRKVVKTKTWWSKSGGWEYYLEVHL